MRSQASRVLRSGQPIIDFDAADNCRLYVTTYKEMKLEDDILSFSTDNFKDQQVPVFN